MGMKEADISQQKEEIIFHNKQSNILEKEEINDLFFNDENDNVDFLNKESVLTENNKKNIEQSTTNSNTKSNNIKSIEQNEIESLPNSFFDAGEPDFFNLCNQTNDRNLVHEKKKLPKKNNLDLKKSFGKQNVPYKEIVHKKTEIEEEISSISSKFETLSLENKDIKKINNENKCMNTNNRCNLIPMFLKNKLFVFSKSKNESIIEQPKIFKLKTRQNVRKITKNILKSEDKDIYKLILSQKWNFRTFQHDFLKSSFLNKESINQIVLECIQNKKKGVEKALENHLFEIAFMFCEKEEFEKVRNLSIQQSFNDKYAKILSNENKSIKTKNCKVFKNYESKEFYESQLSLINNITDSTVKNLLSMNYKPKDYFFILLYIYYKFNKNYFNEYLYLFYSLV